MTDLIIPLHPHGESIIDESLTVAKIVDAAHKADQVIINFLGEAAPVEELIWLGKKFIVVLETICIENNWPKHKFRLVTGNWIQDDNVWPNIRIKDHLLINAFTHMQSKTIATKKNFTRYFGNFIGGSSFSRLFIASQLFTKFGDKTCQTFRRDPNNPMHASKLYIDQLIFQFASEKLWQNQYLNDISNLLAACPIEKDYDKYLLNKDHHGYEEGAWDSEILSWYNSFFCDIVCNTFVLGKQFCLDEKIGRPIVMGNPFIVLGPKGYLHNLKRLGFKTFGTFWNESYDDTTGAQRCVAVMDLIEQLSKKTLDQIKAMHNEMQPILAHNQQRYQQIDQQQILKHFPKVDIS
jgi:hypothetical protein